MRELQWMVVGKCRQEWDHTSGILAMLVNLNRNRSQPRVLPVEFNPFRRKRKAKIVLKGEQMKAVLCAAFVH